MIMLTLSFSQELNLYRYSGTLKCPQEKMGKWPKLATFDKNIRRFFQTIYDDTLISDAPVYYLSESERRVMKKALFRSAKIVHKGRRVK